MPEKMPGSGGTFTETTRYALRRAALLAALASPPARAQLDWPGCPAPVDADFVKTTLLAKSQDAQLAEPLRVDVDGRNRIYIAMKRSGQLLRFDPAGAYRKVVLGTLPVTPLNFHGFLGMALSPDFLQTGHIFTLTTHRPAAPILFRISRYAVKGDSLDLASGKIILEWPTDLTEGHTGGDMAFGPDGSLYVTTGNDTWAYPSQIPNPTQSYENIDYRTPIDEREPQFNALRSSANAADLRGKLLRIKPLPVAADHPAGSWGAGVTYAIPPGNLFPAGKPGTRAEIFAMGFRNPYTLHVDPDGRAFLADVGPQGGGTTLTGPSGGDQLYIASKPANHGFPMFVDGKRPYPIYDFAQKKVTGWFDAKVPVNFSRFNTGIDTLPPVSPAAAVSHWEEALNKPGWFKAGGMVLISGPVYHYDSKSPSKDRFPPHFDGKWIIADYQQNLVKVVSLKGDSVVDVRGLWSSLTFNNVVDMKFAPDGSLILVEYANIWNSSTPSTKVSRIAYRGSCHPVTAIPGPRVRGPDARELVQPGVARLHPPAGAQSLRLFDLEGREILAAPVRHDETFVLPRNLRGRLLVARYGDKP